MLENLAKVQYSLFHVQVIVPIGRYLKTIKREHEIDFFPFFIKKGDLLPDHHLAGLFWAGGGGKYMV